MDPIRWTILGAGVLVLIGIYALGRWRERRRQARHGEAGGDRPEHAAAPRYGAGGGEPRRAERGDIIGVR
ncbi:hypothetical protein, partial [Halorhodospira neutriphila]